MIPETLACPRCFSTGFDLEKYEALIKTLCRIVMIVVILIAEGFRQAGELESLGVAFGNEKKKMWLFKT